MKTRNPHTHWTVLLACLAAGLGHAADARGPAPAPGACRHGYVLVLPGIWNTRFQFDGFVEAARERHPGFDVEVRPWGTPFLGLQNLAAYERNLTTAAEIANALALRRQRHPSELLYVVGYSGGGGLAAMVAAALPAGVAIDRLVLVAPAISPDFPLAELVLPHVDEVVVNYASARDLQVGWGTSLFGTVDRRRTRSAGGVGFALEHRRLLQWRWSGQDADLHGGTHLAYLRPDWQRAALLPALDPDVGARELRRRWRNDARRDAAPVPASSPQMNRDPSSGGGPRHDAAAVAASGSTRTVRGDAQ